MFWLRRHNTWVICRQSCNRIGEFIKMSVSKLHPIHVSTQNILHQDRNFVKCRSHFHTLSLMFYAMATFSLRSIAPRANFYKCLTNRVICLSTARHIIRNNRDLITPSWILGDRTICSVSVHHRYFHGCHKGTVSMKLKTQHPVEVRLKKSDDRFWGLHSSLFGDSPRPGSGSEMQRHIAEFRNTVWWRLIRWFQN